VLSSAVYDVVARFLIAAAASNESSFDPLFTDVSRSSGACGGRIEAEWRRDDGALTYKLYLDDQAISNAPSVLPQPVARRSVEPTSFALLGFRGRREKEMAGVDFPAANKSRKG